MKYRTKDSSKTVMQKPFVGNKEAFEVLQLFKTFSRVVKMEFLFEPSETVHGDLKSQKSSLLNQKCKWLCITFKKKTIFGFVFHF